MIHHQAMGPDLASIAALLYASPYLLALPRLASEIEQFSSHCSYRPNCNPSLLLVAQNYSKCVLRRLPTYCGFAYVLSCTLYYMSLAYFLFSIFFFCRMPSEGRRSEPWHPGIPRHLLVPFSFY